MLEKINRITNCGSAQETLGLEGLMRSTFPKLKSLGLYDLASFMRWESICETEEQRPIFPLLKDVVIVKCQMLTTLPGASKLINLRVGQGNKLTYVQSVKHINFLTNIIVTSVANQQQFSFRIMHVH